MRTHYCGLVSAAQLDETVNLCGWVNTRRDHGGTVSARANFPGWRGTLTVDEGFVNQYVTGAAVW